MDTYTSIWTELGERLDNLRMSHLLQPTFDDTLRALTGDKPHLYDTPEHLLYLAEHDTWEFFFPKEEPPCDAPTTPIPRRGTGRPVSRRDIDNLVRDFRRHHNNLVRDALVSAPRHHGPDTRYHNSLSIRQNPPRDTRYTLGHQASNDTMIPYDSQVSHDTYNSHVNVAPRAVLIIEKHYMYVAPPAIHEPDPSVQRQWTQPDIQTGYDHDYPAFHRLRNAHGFPTSTLLPPHVPIDTGRIVEDVTTAESVSDLHTIYSGRRLKSSIHAPKGSDSYVPHVITDRDIPPLPDILGPVPLTHAVHNLAPATNKLPLDTTGRPKTHAIAPAAVPKYSTVKPSDAPTAGPKSSAASKSNATPAGPKSAGTPTPAPDISPIRTAGSREWNPVGPKPQPKVRDAILMVTGARKYFCGSEDGFVFVICLENDAQVKINSDWDEHEEKYRIYVYPKVVDDARAEEKADIAHVMLSQWAFDTNTRVNAGDHSSMIYNVHEYWIAFIKKNPHAVTEPVAEWSSLPSTGDRSHLATVPGPFATNNSATRVAGNGDGDGPHRFRTVDVVGIRSRRGRRPRGRKILILE